MTVKRSAFVVALAMTQMGTEAAAGALEQTNQNLMVMFEPGTYAEFGYATAQPTVKGTDVLGNGTGDVGPRYGMASFGIKTDLTDQLSAALLLDQPFGITVNYGPASPVFGGTQAKLDSTAVTAVLRYRLDENWSVHGGLRGQWVEASARLAGLQAGPFDGYTATIDRDFGLGFVLGAAYEIPDIALRVALTYNSEVRHDGSISEFLPAAVGGPATAVSPNRFSTPQSLNLDLQTGIAEGTLLFGSIRWVDWSAFRLSPAQFSGIAGEPLASYPHDIVTYTIGVGRQVSESLSVIGALAYEDEKNRLGSALGPVNGYTSLSLAAIHETESRRISVGVSHLWLRDADPQAGGATVGNFSDNRLVAVEMKIGFKF